MLKLILNTLSVASSWLTPGKQAQRKRTRQRVLQREIDEITSQPPTAKRAIKLAELKAEKEEINAYFIAREN